ncbi:hypothetical protein [Methylomicrobium sp. Wu6]|uniref:hypothetical protein n=1 Tax=Methylomicrobium sp. Wu6 TaxID=3107928 RepID=UPI002DD62809|nr:hypothetical protein [Methylomicrobium sp. Wu6]MEC4747886.1 hypothetical protein [Methylomicrobium sp. Wu6]
MSIKTRLERLEKLEQRQQTSTPRRLELIGVLNGETKEQAVDRWKAENPGAPTPDSIIFLVPFGYEEAKPHAP